MPKVPKSRAHKGPAFYTTRKIARLFGVSVPTVSAWIDEGRLKGHRTPGGHRRVRAADLASFAEAHGYPLPPELRHLLGPPRVLVIDAERDFADMVRDYLNLRGDFDVRVADGAFAAGYLMGSFQPHVVLLDTSMTDLDPHQVIRTLRSDDRMRATRIVGSDIYRGMLNGRVRRDDFDGWFQKPVGLDVLLELVNEALRAARVGPSSNS